MLFLKIAGGFIVSDARFPLNCTSIPRDTFQSLKLLRVIYPAGGCEWNVPPFLP